uniref:Uncharacterized protein n=1 Tax=Musa acuminata subsp. malaccensis TaxID=214687 RepID=A0A804K324_MUSAM|nr:PREDICTED: uncharacterized protein LOC103993800 isoform X2 [Musa acuminata subsp. malaccensis]
MITRSKLVEQLREYQIRSQHKWGALAAFSPKPQMTTRRDVFVALTFALADNLSNLRADMRYWSSMGYLRDHPTMISHWLLLA